MNYTTYPAGRAVLCRAAAKNRMSGNWSRFNDRIVTGLEPSEVQGSSAYVLFYSKVG